jgi:cytochrome c oxidase subunit 3
MFNKIFKKNFFFLHFTYVDFKHSFHTVTRSPWPFMISSSLFVFIVGIVLKLQNFFFSHIFLNWGFFFFSFFLIRWFLDILIESLTGHHTRKVSTGLRLGFFLMIVSEIMFFFSFFWSLFHYSFSLNINTGQAWPYILGIPPYWGTPLVGTFFLLLSSWWISEAKMCFLHRNYRFFLYNTFCTLWCGFMFLYIQWEEFLTTILTFNNGTYGSIFFMLTGFHGFHVIVGMIFITSVFYRSFYNKYIFILEKSILFDVTIWYWHFVDYVW